MILGIDLGTTNSLICYLKDGVPTVIPNATGYLLTPSVVSLDETGTMLVGAIAKERSYKYPQLTAHSFKRLMGTQQTVKLGKEYYDAEDLSALILRSLKADAEAFLGEAVSDVVISVPAYFNDAQRKSTKTAGELAGLNVKRLINEPTAAALFHGIQEYATEAKFLIFDLGGGTFDVSILEKFEGIMEVRATGGDSFLGGDDFTQAIVDLFISKSGLSKSQRTSVNNLAAMRFAAEVVKRKLSETATVQMEVKIEGKPISVDISQDDFEKACKPLLDRLRAPIERALRDARLRVGDLNELVMVGGSTRMPLIRKLVTQLFGRLPARYIDPDQTIALGAAVCAGLIARDITFDEVVLTDVCPHSLGTEVREYDDRNTLLGLVFLPIIERNTIVPASRVKTVVTAEDNQPFLEISIYQGESRDCSKNILLEKLKIEVPPRPKGEIYADIRYTYDINGILEVDVDVEKTGLSQNVVINKLASNVTAAEIEERRHVLAALKVHPRNQEENRYQIERAGRLFEQLLGQDREHVGLVLNQFLSVVEKQDPISITKAREALSSALNSIERGEMW